MAGFDEQTEKVLLDLGTHYNQITAIKTFLNDTNNIEGLAFDHVDFPQQPFRDYAPKENTQHNEMGIADNWGIDARIAKIERGRLTTDNANPKYIKVILTADFERHHSAGYLLSLIDSVLYNKPQPFTKGVMTYSNEGRKTIEYTLHETAEEAIKHKQKYVLQQIKPHLAFFYSINAIGDTIIEVHNKSS